MTSGTSAAPGPRRAIWGLVNDGYALVAKTANITHDEAFELCRVPDIGDPSAYLDHGVAYLHSPTWGHVFARYFTNAERDSAGRASLVYDVVALSDVDFAALGNDAFRALPPLAGDRKPERFGELPTPAVTPADDATEAARLSALLAQVDQAAVTTLLGALLAGDHVLCIAPGFPVEIIECLTLLLPPALRPLVTFQVPTADFPKHTPRLTVAERGHASLVEREWSVVLPRDADDPRLAEPTSVAERFVALGMTGDRLRRAWSATPAANAGGRADLAAAVAAMLRLDLLSEALRAGDLRRTVLVAARAESAEERLWLADLIFEQATPNQVAAALADVVRGEQRGAWLAAHALATAVAWRREKQPERFASFFATLLDSLRDVPRPVGDTTARDVHVLLACAAASLDDLGRFLDVADPELPWDTAWRDGSARWVKGRSAVARLFDALAAKGATYADAIEGVHAIGGVAATTTGRARDRASAIGLSLVRRTLRDRATLEPPDRLGALVEGLMRVWALEGAGTSQLQRSVTAASTEVERALRRFLGVGEPVAGGDPRRLAADLSRTVAESSDGGDAELLGWIIAALERAHAGAVGELTVRAVAALLDEQRRLVPRAELPVSVGRVLLHFATSDAAFVFRPAWLDVARQADDASRRELLARALAWVARGYANGRFTIGAFADACVVAGMEGITIDHATAELLVPHLASAARERDGATELALLVATVASIATPAAVERLSDAVLGVADDAIADTVRMRRLALALHEIERVRDEDRFGEARAALRRVLGGHALGPDEERALRVFLGIEDGTIVGRLLGRLPSLTPRGTTLVGDGR
jgi:hypothetical protein